MSTRTKPDTGTAHTPGPWELVSLSGYGSPYSIRMAYHSDNPNAPKTHYGVQSVRTKADALLIAAAPELLRVAKRLAHAASMEPGQDRLAAFQIVADEARAALAKAEGRQP